MKTNLTKSFNIIRNALDDIAPLHVRANSEAFQDRLIKSGFTISYGDYSYWNNQPYVEITDKRIYLIETEYEGNSSYLVYRRQTDVIDDIYSAIISAYESLDRYNNIKNKLFTNETEE